MSKNKENQSNTPYKNCLNCGTELNGKYCHSCGQQASDPHPSIGSFFMEYFSNALMWDTRFFKSIWLLIRKPGYLTNEFISGKFISYIHPLKMNMFMLFVLLTLFLLFSGTDELNKSFDGLSKNEGIIYTLQVQEMMQNPEYVQKLMESPRDTIKIIAPSYISEKHPDIITCIEAIEISKGNPEEDKWIAVVPRLLIEDNIIFKETEDYYGLNSEAKGSVQNDIKELISVWRYMVSFLTKYFPLLILFTAPFLSFAIRLVKRKTKLPYINHFIFSLHYTALLELIAICVYVAHLMVNIPMPIFQIIFILWPCIYLTIAFRRVYGTTSWIRATGNALFTSFIYFLIILITFMFIFIIASTYIASLSMS